LIKGLAYGVGVLVVLVVLGWGYLALAEPLVLNPSEPLVSSGTAMVMLCGEGESFMQVMKTVPDPDSSIGTWSQERRGECDIWYHYPSGSD
jgi:hypothetical protein